MYSHYHKCEVKNKNLGMMHIVLMRGYNWKKSITIKWKLKVTIFLGHHLAPTKPPRHSSVCPPFPPPATTIVLVALENNSDPHVIMTVCPKKHWKHYMPLHRQATYAGKQWQYLVFQDCFVIPAVSYLPCNYSNGWQARLPITDTMRRDKQ